MKKYFLIASFFSAFLCHAQDALFVVISVKGNVTLDGNTIICGQKVTSAEKELKIEGENAYAKVLTEKGYAFTLHKGTHEVKNISVSKNSNIEKALKPTGVIHDGPSSYPIQFVGIERQHYLYEDTIAILWKPKADKKSIYSLAISDMLEDEVYKTVTQSNFVILEIGALFKKHQGKLMYSIKTDSRKVFSYTSLVQREEKRRDQISYDLFCIQNNDFVVDELSKLSIFETYELYDDQLYHLIKLHQHEKSSGVKITHPYYKRLIELFGIQNLLIE